MATTKNVTSPALRNHIPKWTSELEYILHYVEGKKEEFESWSIENKKLCRKGYSSNKVKCNVKKNEVVSVTANKSNNAVAAPHQTEDNCMFRKQLAEIALIDQVLNKADVTWRKHKPAFQTVVDDNKSVFTERESILDSMKSLPDIMKVSFSTENNLKNSDVGIISEAALVQALKGGNLPKTKPVSCRSYNDISFKNHQMLCERKQATKPPVKGHSKPTTLKKDYSKFLNKSEKNQPCSELSSCTKEQVKVSSPKCEISRSNDDYSTVRSCFMVPPNIKTLWRQNYSLRQNITQLSQSSQVTNSFCSMLEMEMESSVPCDKLQAIYLSKQYEDLNKLLKTLDSDCLSNISSPKDIFRVLMYINHILIKLLDINKRTEVLLKKAQYSSKQHQAESIMAGVKTEHTLFISKSKVPFEFWLPPYLYESFERRKELSLNLSYTSLKELNMYWQLSHQLQLNILSEYLLELFANSLIFLLSSADVPKRDRLLIFRILQGILWHSGEQFPVLLESRGSTG